MQTKVGGQTKAFVFEWSVLLPGHFTTAEASSGTDWVGGWVETREISCASQKYNSSSSSVEPVAKSLYRLRYHGSLLILFLFK